jgi:hypothetical protein
MATPKGDELPTFKIARSKVDETTGLTCYASNRACLSAEGRYLHTCAGPLTGGGVRSGLFGIQGDVEAKWSTVEPVELLARALIAPESSHSDLVACLRFPMLPDVKDKARAFWALGLALSSDFEMLEKLVRLYFRITADGEVTLTTNDVSDLLLPAAVREKAKMRAAA